MRMTTLFRRLLGVTRMYVEEVSLSAAGLSIKVRPTARKSRCGQCGRRSYRYDRAKERGWTHLPIGRVRVVLRYRPWRVVCHDCGVRVEEVAWARHSSRFSLGFEEMAAYLAQVTDKTQVSRLLGLSWQAVGSIVARVVSERLDSDRFDGLRRIGIDEFSYRKRHRYLTVVVDHDRRRVIWAGQGRSAETLDGFFELLGEQRRDQIEEVTIDMAGGYIKAIAENLPGARVIFDRFHVERLAADAVDEVRREQVRDLGSRGKAIKGLRFLLLKHPDGLKPSEHQRLRDLRVWNKQLWRAYDLKEYLAEILELGDPQLGRSLLRDWLAWACRSKLPSFVKLSRTIRRHFEGIAAYIDTKMTNGIVEGFNNKLRVIARRAYGFHSAESLTAMLFLCCGGIELDPPLTLPI